jgi:proteasome lid subunit RPN8/RPN11
MASAVTAAKTHREICGLILDTGFCLELLECKNKSRRPASFSFYYGEVRSIVKAAGVVGHEVVGTFHSHPVAVAEPGKADIANAVDDSLMLLMDCSDRKIELWRIKNGKARKLPFDEIEHRGARGR